MRRQLRRVIITYTEPKVSTIIPNWNGLEDTTECLEFPKKITYPNYDVIVVDNGFQANRNRHDNVGAGGAGVRMLVRLVGIIAIGL